MTTPPASAQIPQSILIVDADVVPRHVIADYLRRCGYAVIEAASADEALVALKEQTLSIDVVLCEVTALGSQGCFELATWVRKNRPELEVKLAGGLAMAAETAAELCEVGPHLRRPYDPSAVVEYVKRIRAGHSRDDGFRAPATLLAPRVDVE